LLLLLMLLRLPMQLLLDLQLELLLLLMMLLQMLLVSFQLIKSTLLLCHGLMQRFATSISSMTRTCVQKALHWEVHI
jgi:hypothetical protein